MHEGPGDVVDHPQRLEDLGGPREVEFGQRQLPGGRFGRPEEVAAVVAFLASPRASWVNSACWVVHGGQSQAF